MESTSKNKVYAAQYNPCYHESDYGTFGIYATREGAQKACDDYKALEEKSWKEMGYDSIPEYQLWRVEEYEVIQ